jgi:ATP-dependent Lon protease
MTGEITLRGRILPVGGIREKVLAAHRSGLRTIILPTRNQKDLIDVPKRARSELKLIPVEHMDQVLEIALAGAPKVSKARPKRSMTSTKSTADGPAKPAADVPTLRPGV